MEIPSQKSKEKKIVEGEFSQEFYMDKEELANFLRNLADQVENQQELRITSNDWVLPFKPLSNAKIDIDLDGSELEIEIEFKKKTDPLYIEEDSSSQNESTS